MVLCSTIDWLNTLEMIHNGTKTKQEPTRGTTAEEQPKLPHITKKPPPEPGKPTKHRDRSQATPSLLVTSLLRFDGNYT